MGALTAALLLSGCSGPSGATSYTPPTQAEGSLPKDMQGELTDAVTRAMAATGSSGAIVGVWAPWSGSWVEGLGTVAHGEEKPVTTDMSFRIGDVTRMMTCDVLYALVDRGVVKLDDPVTDYVAGIPNMSDVTLLNLCNGTSGLGSSKETTLGAYLGNPTREWSPKALASYGIERGRTAPGLSYRDSDAAYLLLGVALERASGTPAADLIATYVTDPLGLSRTRLPEVAPSAPDTGGPVLKGSYVPKGPAGYDCAAPVDITVSSSSIGFTDAGVVSTIEDLGRYAQADARQALRLKKEPNRFGSPLPAVKDGPSWYQATGGAYLVGSMIGQQGWAPGYLTAAYSDPASGFTVAVVLNGSSATSTSAGFLAWELAAIASKAPPAEGQTAPEFALPFTAERYRTEGAGLAICPLPPAEPAAENG
ncbi:MULTISPECIES: serine hydrolase domain-containing protein [Bacteria]|uniref:serine hydrolase domain-containing protein n=1 Tax=Bacteria TaxID=2 RepID=UPI003C7CA69B